MKKRWFVWMVVAFMMVLAACGNEKENLTRVDVTVGTKTNTITNQEKIESIEKLVNSTKWDPNTTPSMTKKENGTVTLFYKQNDHDPERLTTIRVWINKEAKSVTLLSDDPDQGYAEVKDSYEEWKALVNTK